ncbi:MAG TPA: lipopolysaccharide biosynthesis protein [Candidatus Moranbacteria bacterium]|nr:lipopolysaccharide biosynthesis protein [Candidatus Moranbacteria bacterium]
MKTRIIKGITWNVFQLFADQGFSMLVKIILARLLLPEHFGIIGMAIIFSGFFSAISDAGLGAALIRFKKEKLEDIHYQTVFWSSLVFSGLLYFILIFGITPFAVWFYKEAILSIILPVIGISLILNSFNIIPKIILSRELNFKSLSIVSITSNLFGGIIAIILAFLGAGVWSIILQGLISGFISIPIFWYFIDWKPKFNFSKEALKDILGFGLYETGLNMLGYFTRNIDYLIVGKLLGASLLGIYTMAFTITDIFRQQIMGILNKIMFPVYGIMQDDFSKIKKYYLKVIKFNTIFLLPFLLPLIICTKPLILIIFGEKWILAEFPIQAMAVASIIHGISGTTDSVFKGIGKVNITFKISLIKIFIITIPSFVVLIYFFGINGAAIAVIAHKSIGRIIHQYYMKKIICVSELDILNVLKEPFFASIIPIILLVLISSYVDIYAWEYYIIGIAVSIVIYMLSIYFMMKSEIGEIFKR